MSRMFFASAGPAGGPTSPPVVFPEVPSPFLVNTSASPNYNATGIPGNFNAGQTHDKSLNFQAGNVSGEDIHNLLYPGNVTQVYAVLTDWFPHTDSLFHGTGYTSNTTTHADAMVTDVKRRGINGICPSWYGFGHGTTNDNINAAALKALAACEAQGVQFVLMHVNPVSGLTQAQAIADMDYANSNFFGSSAYLKIGGRPVYVFFDSDSSFDWSAIRSHANGLSNGSPLFYFRNASGFTHASADGAFAWLGDNQPPGTATDYLDSFYATALTSGKKYFGSIWKGMDQTLATWSEGRHIDQLNGQMLLDTIGRIPAAGFNSSKQLKYLLWATWNDYQEGTEIETGIDSGITFSASYSAPVLSWTVTAGNENVIKQYDVLETTDDATFHLLGSISVGATYSYAVHDLSAGTHKLYVVGRGVCSMATPVSSAVTITV